MIFWSENWRMFNLAFLEKSRAITDRFSPGSREEGMPAVKSPALASDCLVLPAFRKNAAWLVMSGKEKRP